MKALQVVCVMLAVGACSVDTEEEPGIDVVESELTASTTCVETCGDVNADRKITITDAVLIGRYAAGLDNPSTCKLKASDVNGDYRVTVTDQVIVQNAAAGLVDSRTFKCPSPIQWGPLTKY